MAEAVLKRTFLAGIPATSWAFALRVWIAMVVALYLSFWLELEAPTSAALTVAILALPTRGQGLEKAGVRISATAIGVCASIAIFGIFSQTDGLLLAVLSAWIGLCVFAAGLLDGNRAYAAALGIITVSLIGIQQIDSPQGIFASGLARGAAIAVGILATMLVNDLLATPDYHLKIATDLVSLQQRALGYAQSVLRGESVSATTVAALLGAVVALRPEVSALGTESSNGPARTAAARTALVRLAAIVAAVRAMQGLPSCATPPLADRLVSSLHNRGGAGGRPQPQADRGDVDLIARAYAVLARDLEDGAHGLRQDLQALRAGSYPAVSWRTPLFRCWRIALGNGVRSGVCFALAAAVFALTGWPSLAVSLSLVAILIGLGATTPDPRAFTTLAVMTIPFACLIAGVVEFVILDGADAFPLLAIALAPVAIGPALLMTAPKPAFVAVGRLLLIFIVAVLAPNSPQSYNPQSFLFTALFACLATLLLFAIQSLVPPLSAEVRLRRLMPSARDTRLPVLHDRRFAPEEQTFRDAGRVSQIMAAAATLPAAHSGACLDEAMSWFDRNVALRTAAASLADLAGPALLPIRNAAYAALSDEDADALMRAARALQAFIQERDGEDNDRASAACARLTLASLALAAGADPASSRRD